MLLWIISAVITLAVFKLIANYCDKHNIDIPGGGSHPEWKKWD